MSDLDDLFLREWDEDRPDEEGYYPMPKRNHELVTISNVYVKHATEKALLCLIRGEEVWVPRSQIDESSEVQDDLNASEGDLVVTQWIAEQKGWE